MPASLRSGFAWTFAGNAVYAAGQWAALSLAAKLGGADVLGAYALAVAVAAPISMLAHLNLRAVLATDMAREHPFGDYLALRLRVSGLGLAALGLLAAVSGYPASLAAAILLAGFSHAAEAASDIYYGAMQRRGEMERIGRSMMARGVLSAFGFGAALGLGGGLLWALAAGAAGRLAVLLLYDRPRGSAGERLSGSGWRAQRVILRTALPLGAVLMLISLNTNLPRYAIERSLGVRELGAFAAVASFVTVGNTIANALGQAATPRLAAGFSGRDRAGFRALAWKLAGCLFAAGLAGVAAAALLGKPLLALLYRPEYAAYSGLLVAVMAAAVPGYVAIGLGFVITATRAFTAQVPLFCAVAATCGLMSWLLAPRFGLHGAAAALAAAALVQIGGSVLVLGRAFHRLESPA